MKYPLKHYALVAVVILAVVFIVSPQASLFLLELVFGVGLAVLILVFIGRFIRAIWRLAHHKPHTSH